MHLKFSTYSPAPSLVLSSNRALMQTVNVLFLSITNPYGARWTKLSFDIRSITCLVNDTSFLLSASFPTLAPPPPDDDVLKTEGLERKRAIFNPKPPAGCPAASPSIRNGNARSGGNGGNESGFPSPSTFGSIFGAPNHTPGLPRFPNFKTSIGLPTESLEDVPDKLRITLYPQTQHHVMILKHDPQCRTGPSLVLSD